MMLFIFSEREWSLAYYLIPIFAIVAAYLVKLYVALRKGKKLGDRVTSIEDIFEEPL